MNEKEGRSRERMQRTPEIAFSIFYGAHGSAKDVESLGVPLKNSDIVIPETMGWSQGHVTYYRALANGRVTPKEALRRFSTGQTHYMLTSDTALKVFEMIYNSHKYIAFADVPDGHPLVRRFLHIYSSGFPIDDNFEQTLKNARNYMKDTSSLDLDRENFILSRLQPTVNQVLKEAPSLARKQKLNVLLFLGAAHTRIYRELKRTGTEVNATFSYKPFVYPFSTEAERRYAFGKEIGDELVAKSFMEAIVVIPGMQKITKDFRKISLYARRALSGFTLDEIESVFYDMKRNRSYDIFMNLLSQKGVVVPLTEKMLDDFLKKEKLI